MATSVAGERLTIVIEILAVGAALWTAACGAATLPDGTLAACAASGFPGDPAACLAMAAALIAVATASGAC